MTYLGGTLVNCISQSPTSLAKIPLPFADMSLRISTVRAKVQAAKTKLNNLGHPPSEELTDALEQVEAGLRFYRVSSSGEPLFANALYRSLTTSTIEVLLTDRIPWSNFQHP